jgi:hypothetical protein
MLSLRSQVCALVLAISLTACSDRKDALGPRSPETGTAAVWAGGPSSTMGSGSTSKLLGRSTFSAPGDDENFDVKRKTGHWQIEIKAKPEFDIAVQTISFDAGGQSGWHSHPGPVFIQVVSGTMTFYESDDPTCTPIVRTAGQSYLDLGDHAHIARNETRLPAQNVVTYFAPPGALLKIDAPKPGNCPF